MELIEYLEDEFEKNRNELNAAGMSAYMKGQFSFYGIKSPTRKDIVKLAWKSYRMDTEEQFSSFLLKAWEKDEREWQYAAMDVMEKSKRLFSGETILLLKHLITTKSWWDTVDRLASHGVGHYFLQYPETISSTVSEWMDSGNIWLQRSCLLFQLKYGKSTDFELLSQLTTALAGSNEFFIAKAAGWALRQYSKVNQDSVRDYINSHRELQPLTRKEGLKYC